MIKKSTKGKLGKSLIYSITNIRLEGSTLKWDEWKMYSPKGNLTDESGNLYFTIPAVELSLDRDDILDKEFTILVKIDGGAVETQAIFNFIGDSRERVNLDQEGDHVCCGQIPADTNQELYIEYREVTNEG